MADCFWTDFVGCVEDCGEAPPVGPSMLNVLTWNVINGCMDEAGTYPDAYGDVGQSVGTDTNLLGPSSVPWTKIVPCIAVSRGAAPDCFSSVCAPCGTAGTRIGVSVHFTPYPGGEAALGWTFQGAYSSSPFAIYIALLDDDDTVVWEQEPEDSASASIHDDENTTWTISSHVLVPTEDYPTATKMLVQVDWWDSALVGNDVTAKDFAITVEPYCLC